MVGHTVGTNSVILYALHTMPGRIAPHNHYDPSAGQEGARAGGHSWRKVLGRYGRGQLREDEGDGQVGLVRALVHLL